MLQGDAKRDYQRDYMRRKRAGEPTRKPPQPPKPKQPWQPTQRMADKVRYWFGLKLNRPSYLRGIGWKVVNDLDPNNADGTPNRESWNEALRRYQALDAEQRVEREERAKREADYEAERKISRCSFCGEPAPEGEILVGIGRHPLICESCTEKVVAIIAEHRASKRDATTDGAS